MIRGQPDCGQVRKPPVFVRRVSSILRTPVERPRGGLDHEVEHPEFPLWRPLQPTCGGRRAGVRDSIGGGANAKNCPQSRDPLNSTVMRS